MKKKDLYILLGVGIGFVVSSMIFYIASFFIASDKSNTLTNEEVEIIAREMGMVFPDEVAETLPEDTETEVVKDVTTTTPSSESIAVSQTDENDSTKDEETDDTDISSKDKSSDEASVIDTEDSDKENSDTDKDTKKTTESDKTISFVIPSGHTSVDISNNLESIGLIDDATKFNNVLVANELDRIIRPNNYTVSASIEEDELIYLITGHKVTY